MLSVRKLLIWITFSLLLLLYIFMPPWTLPYWNQKAKAEINRRWNRSGYQEDYKVTVVTTACGDQSSDQIVVLLKSILLSSIHFRLGSIDVHFFTNDENVRSLSSKVEAIKKSTVGINFHYEIHPSIYPSSNVVQWEKLFKPCSAQRLFLASALSQVKEALYLDADTLVVGDLGRVWSTFESMNSKQAMALVEEVDFGVGWYDRRVKYPFYPPNGLNAGVILMNLTTLRQGLGFDWELSLLNAYEAYKNIIPWGDQDLINIIFHNRTGMVNVLPCTFNFRTDNCKDGFKCNLTTDQKENGIQIIHGNRGLFLNTGWKGFSLFPKLYQYFERFDMMKDDFITDIVKPFIIEALLTGEEENADDCSSIGRFIFTFA